MKNKAFYSFLLALVLIFSLVTPAAVATGVDTDDCPPTPTPDFATVVEDTAPVSPVADVEAAPTATPASADPTDTPTASTAAPEAAAEPTDSAEPSVEPSAEPTDSAEPAPSVEPTATVAPAETTAVTVEYVQSLIDALPDADAINDENRADVEAQLEAIDDAKLLLTQEQRDTINFARYSAAIAALGEGDEPSILTETVTLNGFAVAGYGGKVAVTQSFPSTSPHWNETVPADAELTRSGVDEDKIGISAGTGVVAGEYGFSIFDNDVEADVANGTFTVLTLDQARTQDLVKHIVGLRVARLDSNNNTKAGVQYGIYKEADCSGTPVATFTTDANGDAYISTESISNSADLPSASGTTYYLRELNGGMIWTLTGKGEIIYDSQDEKQYSKELHMSLKFDKASMGSDGDDPNFYWDYGPSSYPPDKLAIYGMSYAVNYSGGKYGTGSIASAVKVEDVDLTLSGASFTREGHTQVGWALTDGGAKAYDLGGTYKENKQQTFYPVWQADNCTVTWDANGGTLDTTGATHGEVATGTAIVAPTATRAADAQYTYTFDGWYLVGEDGTETKVTDFGTATANVTYKAHWTPTLRQYTVTWDANGGTLDTTGATGTADYGTAITPPTANPTKTDAQYTYTFDGWYDAQSGGNKLTASTTITGNVTYYAHWTQGAVRQYTLSFNSNGGTDVSPITANYGTVIDVSNIKPYCYGCIFTGWYTDATFKTRVTGVTLTQETTLVAGWVLNTYVGPHTGDDSNLALWLALLTLSTAALTTTATVLKKKRKG